MTQPLQEVVKGLACVILELDHRDYLDGFAVGGSIARGSYKLAQYIYANVLFRNSVPQRPIQRNDITAIFEEATGLRLHILAWEQRGFPLSELGPATFYVFRSENERLIWQPPEKARFYLAIPKND